MDDWFGLQGGLVAVGLLAAVPGCKDPDPDPDTDTTIGNTTSTEPGSTGDTGGTSTSSGTTGDTPTGTGSASDTTTGDIEVPPECVSYGAKFAECLTEPTAAMAYEQMCGNTLMYYAKYYGADCSQASEAWFACLSALNCEEFLGNKMDDLPVCETEDMARQTACN